MKRNDLFVLKNIEGSVYLMPVGQMIADRNGGIKINSTGSYIWEQLKSDITFDELFERFAAEYEADADEREVLREDLNKLVRSFKDRGMLEGSRTIFGCNCIRCRNGLSVQTPKWNTADDEELKNESGLPLFGRFKIGGLPVEMYGENCFFEESFESFRVNDPEEYLELKKAAVYPMRIEILDIGKEKTDRIDSCEQESQSVYYDEQEKKGGEWPAGENLMERIKSNTVKVRTLIHHSELTVLEYPYKYVLFMNELKGMEELHMSKDGSVVKAYCDPLVKNMASNLFNALRMAFLIYGLEHGKVMLHSCSILYNGRALAFSGSSGTGKTTHSSIWKKLYDVKILNGDLNFMGVENGIPYVYGTPWCGSSGIYDNGKIRLGGIVLLKQGPVNRIEELSDEQKILLIQQRLITSVWNRDMLDKTFEIVSVAVRSIYAKRFYCNKEDEAARILHDDLSYPER